LIDAADFDFASSDASFRSLIDFLDFDFSRFAISSLLLLLGDYARLSQPSMAAVDFFASRQVD